VNAVTIFLYRFQTTVLSRFIFSSTSLPSKFTGNRRLSFLSDARLITVTFLRHPVALSRLTRHTCFRMIPVHSMALRALFSLFLARVRPTDLGASNLPGRELSSLFKCYLAFRSFRHENLSCRFPFPPTANHSGQMIQSKLDGC
jgi:hypothetical protein